MTKQQTNPIRPTLQMPRAEAEARVRTQIQKGQDIAGLRISNKSELDLAEAEYQKWNDFNIDLLKAIVDTYDLAISYIPDPYISPSEGFANKVSRFHQRLKSKLTQLESIYPRLDLIPERLILSVSETPAETVSSNKVFIVHGHDEESKHKAAF